LLARAAIFQLPLRQRLEANLKSARGLLGNGPVRPLWPHGGWTLPLAIPGSEDESFAIALVEQAGVLVQPGYFYDFESEEMCVISLLPEPAIFGEGLRRLIDYAGKRSA